MSHSNDIGFRIRAPRPREGHGVVGTEWALSRKRRVATSVHLMMAASLLFSLFAPAVAPCIYYPGNSESYNACIAREQSANQARTADAILRDNAAKADRNAMIVVGLLSTLILMLATTLVKVFCCQKNQVDSRGKVFCCHKNRELGSLDSSLLSAGQPPDQTKSLSALLADALLSDYEDALRELGCALPTDLTLVEDVELEQLGMKTIEIRRLKALATSNAGQPRPRSLGFTGFE